jgi:CRISPR-associated protein Cmr2
VVEDLYKGKLLYAGGDDVLAMVSVDDLLPAMLLLRLVYSGIFPNHGNVETGWREILGQQDRGNWLDMARGHVRYRKRLYRMMGSKATASAGAVIAHHTTPLSSVLRTLRQAEKTAKNKGQRDAFAISLLKRAGGAVHLTCPWFDNGDMPTDLAQTAMGTLIRLRDSLASPGLSRRAAYLVQQWAAQLPDVAHLGGQETYQDMLATTLAHQFGRQSNSPDRQKNMEMGRELAALAVRVFDRGGYCQPAAFLVDFISVAEFLAREGRGAKLGKENGHG